MRIRSAIAAVAVILGGLAIGGCANKPADQAAADIAWAKAVLPIVQDNAVLQQQRNFREWHSIMFERQLNRAEEAKVPYAGHVMYPAKWPEIVAKRDRKAEQAR